MSEGVSRLSNITTNQKERDARMRIREFDGDRGIDIDVAGNFIVVEAAGHTYAFDRALMLHQIKRAFGIAVILETDLAATG